MPIKFIQKKLLLVLLTVIISQFTFSANVSVKKALTVAVNFAKQQIDAKSTDMGMDQVLSGANPICYSQWYPC